MAAPEPDAYCLRVSLLAVEPEIWRRMLVPGAMTLGQLHRAIQVAMGWGNQHLYEFEIGGACYGPMDEDADDDLIDDATVTLAEVVSAGDRFEYQYDFGDGWVHQVTVESTTSSRPALKLAVCVAGERAGPPEDCGGSGGYGELLEVLADPAHPEHVEACEWVGTGFDPGLFSLVRANAGLQRLR